MIFQKYKMYLRNNLSQKEASEKALMEGDKIIKDMDLKLAKCISKMSKKRHRRNFRKTGELI